MRRSYVQRRRSPAAVGDEGHPFEEPRPAAAISVLRGKYHQERYEAAVVPVRFSSRDHKAPTRVMRRSGERSSALAGQDRRLLKPQRCGGRRPGELSSIGGHGPPSRRGYTSAHADSKKRLFDGEESPDGARAGKVRPPASAHGRRKQHRACLVQSEPRRQQPAPALGTAPGSPALHVGTGTHAARAPGALLARGSWLPPMISRACAGIGGVVGSLDQRGGCSQRTGDESAGGQAVRGGGEPSRSCSAADK